MEPRKAELKKMPKSHKKANVRRFQITKLEERIAPAAGGLGHHGHCNGGHYCR